MKIVCEVCGHILFETTGDAVIEIDGKECVGFMPIENIKCKCGGKGIVKDESVSS